MQSCVSFFTRQSSPQKICAGKTDREKDTSIVKDARAVVRPM